MSDTILEVNQISKKYAGFQLQEVSFTVPCGSIVGLVGENGAGKSTILKSILNLVHTKSGEIRIFDKLNADSQLKEKIGVVFDDCNFSDEMNAKEVNSVLNSIFLEWDSEEFFGLIQKFGMNEKQRIKEYSRGMRMKLSIAAALSHKAKLLVLDEATSGLDPIVRDDVLDVLLDFVKDGEHGVLISSHIISDLEKACDSIVFIHEGRVLLNEKKDVLTKKYAIVKCSPAEFTELPHDIIEAYRESKSGMEALILTEDVPRNVASESATIEEIMLFFIKGKKVA